MHLSRAKGYRSGGGLSGCDIKALDTLAYAKAIARALA